MGSGCVPVQPGETQREQGLLQCSLLTHTMSDRKRKAPDSRQPACMLCGRADVDPNIFGYLCQRNGILVHSFCLLFATGLYQEDDFMVGILGFPLHAITCIAKQANQKQCCVCGERGAAITCAESGCERSFHLPCAVDGECITQFFGQHRSFCWEHHPQQPEKAAPEHDTTCVICLEPMRDSTSYHTLVCPACRSAWFHRGCVQQQAMNAGTRCFQCPICRDKDQFHSEMSTMGIQIPDRRPTWMEDDTYPSLLERHRRCDVNQCLYPGGREQAEREGPWQLILCSSCAAEGTHRQCSYLSNSTNSWECDSCAGLGTASSDNTELAGPSTASQRGLEPSNGSSEPDNFSSRPASQAASGPPHVSQLPEHSDQPSECGTEQRTNCPRSRDNQVSSEQRRGRRGSRRRGSRRRGSRRRGSRRAAAPRAQSSSHTSTRRRTSGSSRASPAATRRRRPRQQGRSRTRSRSPLQGRAPRSQSRPRRRHGSRQSPAPREQRRTRSSARSATSRSSRASSVHQRRGRSTQ
ncbi:PHD finger protein 7-like isoform X2 [Numida meleagris]|uniref:PHD finger protein 7-like isoform X2 n=1 Tax=Numida meleagris TaxID=8996 RepID=UPI000B3D8FD3|nr:PHD finger protein 7-like isoform X2 [Numida meleagris]